MSEPGATEADLDDDGINESVLTDADGDGFADSVASDTDGDGSADTFQYDTTGDGVADVVEYDADGDGQSDPISIPGQTLTLDASGHVVAITTDPVPGESVPADQPATDPYADEPSTGYSDPPLGDTDVTQIGDGGVTQIGDADNWFLQSENGFCVPASVAQIVAEYSDQGVTESVFVDRAIELGYLTYDETSGEWSGLTIQQGEDLLESFGVQATVETGSIETLDAYLDQGYNAIAYIDSSVVWEGDAPGALDHAVVVSSIEDGMVYLNDPGTPDGQLEPVPVEVFEQAWSASNDQMIVTDNPDTGSTGTPGVGQDVYVTPAGASAGTIVLPIVLSGDAVQAWHQLHG